MMSSMIRILNILEKKLELLKNNSTKNEILETDILFTEEYDKMLEKFNVEKIDDINKEEYRDDLLKMKNLVNKIIEIENDDSLINNKKINIKSNKNVANMYKKSMKNNLVK